jgi:AcrR family transcriptional regulator
MSNKKEDILNATVDVLDEYGAVAVTPNLIAEKAKVCEVSLFEEFESKEQLIKDAKEFQVHKLIVKFNRILKEQGEEDVLTYLKRVWIESSSLISVNLNLVRISMEEVRGQPVMLSALSEMLVDKLTLYFEKQLEKGAIRDVNPNVAAINFFSIVFNINVMGKIYGQRFDVTERECLNNFFDIFLNGIKVE